MQHSYGGARFRDVVPVPVGVGTYLGEGVHKLTLSQAAC